MSGMAGLFTAPVLPCLTDTARITGMPQRRLNWVYDDDEQEFLRPAAGAFRSMRSLACSTTRPRATSTLPDHGPAGVYVVRRGIRHAARNVVRALRHTTSLHSSVGQLRFTRRRIRFWLHLFCQSVKPEPP